MKTAKLTNENQIETSFPYDISVIREIKAIYGRTYIKETRQWTFPYSLEACFVLKKLGFTLCPQLRDKANKDYKEQDKPLFIQGLKANLFPYQKEGVKFLERKNGRAIIADEMGLGKTLQALAYLQLHPELRPAVIICPASLKWNWAAEIEKWMTPQNVAILGGTKPYEVDADIFIINYDILCSELTESGKIADGWYKHLQTKEPKVVIMDEAHYIKNSKAQRTKACKALCKVAPHVIPLTGTPIENRTSEIFNLLNMVNSTLFPNQWDFLMTYCRPRKNGFGWTYDNEPHDITRAKNSEQRKKWEMEAKRWEDATYYLHKTLQKIMIRRKKKDVLKDLPDKTYSFIPMELSNEKEYDVAEANFIKYLSSKIKSDFSVASAEIEKRYGISNIAELDDLAILEQAADKDNPLVRLEMLKQLASQGILDNALKWIDDFLENDKKVVIFATHKFIVDALMKKFGRLAVKVDGSVTGKKRQDAVEQFQNNKKIRVFIGNIQAAGVGLTLTAASNVVFLEYPMTPGQLAQAVDRCHRIGQKNAVNVWMLGAKKPIIQKIIQLLQKKQQIIDSTLEGKLSENSDMLSNLYKELF